MPTVVAAHLGGRVTFTLTFIVLVAVHFFRHLGVVCL